jgi:hypothetical protein
MVARLNDFTGGSATNDATVAPGRVTVKVLNGTNLAGAASAVLARFVEIGFQPGGTANDPRGTVEQTEIRYQPGSLDKAKTVFRAVNPDARLVEDETLKHADVAVVVGRNFVSVVAPSAAPAPTTTAPPLAAPAPTTAPSTSTPSTSGSGSGRGSTPTSAPTGSKAGTPAPISNESQLGTPAPKTPPC